MDNTGIIVISGDGKITEKKIKDDTSHHVDLLREYLEEKKLSYSSYLEDSGYKISCFLASILEISIHVENNTYIYFLGNEITDMQYNYFMKNKKSLKRHNTIFCNMEDNIISFYDEYTYPGFNIFDIMMEKIEEKEIISTVDKKEERK